MRVALVQPAATSDIRSANIARLMRLIDQACGCDPAPDLVVFPAGCESGSVGAGFNDVSRAMGDTFVGLMAMKACEWGVFIAGGYHTRDDAGVLCRGVLLDPDGDAVIATASGGRAASMAECMRETVLGAVGLLLGEHLDQSVTDGAAAPCDLLVVCGNMPGETGKAVDARIAVNRLRDLAIRHRCHVCAALPLPPSGRGSRSMGAMSCVLAPDGAPIAQAPAREAVVPIDLAITEKTALG